MQQQAQNTDGSGTYTAAGFVIKAKHQQPAVYELRVKVPNTGAYDGVSWDVLLEDLTSRLGILPHLVVGHGDVAPTKKDDPSVLFPWQRLAEAGFGLWPRDVRAAPPPGFDPWTAMRLVGYDLREPSAALAAFHRHFRGSEETTWLPGDAEILYDLQLQLMELPPTAPVAADQLL